MKKRYILVPIVLAVAATLWWLHERPSRSKNPELLETDEAASAPETRPAETDRAREETRTTSRGAIVLAASATDAVSRYVQNKATDPQFDWKQPINFYGKVVDENNNPVTEAVASFKWTDLSREGTSQHATSSDASGMFSMIDRTGKRLSVTVSKDGYYTPDGEKMRSFEYANPADGLFVPDVNTPVVFHLRKKGNRVDLITSQMGMRSNFPITIPRDGSPVKIDFLERKVSSLGQMLVSQDKPEYADWKKASMWAFKVEIADGGFVEENNEFPFEAPTDGYQQVIEFRFQKENANWAENINKSFYIKFGNPARYGRLQITTSISSAGATLTYSVNPDGTRNLEPR